MPTSYRPVDLVLVGGGLANGLIALRLAERRPELSVLMVEAETRLGGSHTWSFFDSDLDEAQRRWTAPLVAHRWGGYQVRFPSMARRLPTAYASVTSDRFDAVLRGLMGDRIRFGRRAAEIRPDGVVLDDGESIAAGAVIDGRGARPSTRLALGYQAFVGLEARLTRPHGLREPIVMDAKVEQLGGYRFLYVLPLAADRLLIEDTRYVDGPVVDREAYRRGVLDHAHTQGWEIDAVEREEEGVLPVVLDGDPAAYLAEGQAGVAVSGLRAALFHPTTGYSLPDAVRLADLISERRWADGAELAAMVQAHALRLWRERGFYRLLDRMLFKAAEPSQRYRVLERFYRLPTPLVERFYAGRSTAADKARILVGKPPVPIGRALACLLETGRGA